MSVVWCGHLSKRADGKARRMCVCVCVCLCLCVSVCGLGLGLKSEHDMHAFAWV